jgi:hypothetical protein
MYVGNVACSCVLKMLKTKFRQRAEAVPVATCVCLRRGACLFRWSGLVGSMRLLGGLGGVLLLRRRRRRLGLGRSDEECWQGGAGLRWHGWYSWGCWVVAVGERTTDTRVRETSLVRRILL